MACKTANITVQIIAGVRICVLRLERHSPREKKNQNVIDRVIVSLFRVTSAVHAVNFSCILWRF
jgi:hypothetical protein